MVTIYEGHDEVVIVSTWTLAANFELQQSEMHRIEDGISGIEPPVYRLRALPDGITSLQLTPLLA